MYIADENLTERERNILKYFDEYDRELHRHFWDLADQYVKLLPEAEKEKLEQEGGIPGPLDFDRWLICKRREESGKYDYTHENYGDEDQNSLMSLIDHHCYPDSEIEAVLGDLPAPAPKKDSDDELSF